MLTHNQCSDKLAGYRLIAVIPRTKNSGLSFSDYISSLQNYRIRLSKTPFQASPPLWRSSSAVERTFVMHLQRAKSTGRFLARGVTGGVPSI